MKKFVFFILMALFYFAIGQNSVELISQKNYQTVIKFTLKDYELKKVNTPKGEAYVVSAPELTSLLSKGNPDLPKFTASLIIPPDKKMKAEVVAYKTKTLKNIEIAPSKGNLLRTINPDNVPYVYGKTYQKNDFYPYKLVELEKPYILRDFRGIALWVYPFQYNPVTKELKIYTEITVKVYPEGKGIYNTLKQSGYNIKKLSYEYDQIYKKHFLNYSQIINKYTPLEEEGNMLIIAYDDFVDEMQDFVLWKNTIGRHTEIVPLSEVGSTATDIKNYVSNYYNTNGLTFLLLVGDAQQVPTNNGSDLGGDSDNAYGYLEGDDHYQELFVGRFSAQNEDQVLTMVQRTITYEKGDELATGWLNKAMAIASAQGEGQGDDGEADYQHARNMLIDLLNYTYVDPPYELYDGSQGGNDQSGDPTPSDVAAGLNTGAGIITYTGHGGDLEWVTSGFSVSDVHNLNNANKLPFAFSVACVVGNFVSNSECFAESWLRATDGNGNPTGGIGFFGSTINQSWAPPMEAQDEMIDILTEIHENNIKRTFAGIAINGCFQMNDTYQDYDMTDTWTVFGDPSFFVRTDDPSQMTLSYDEVVLYGNPTFTINCDYDGALATISKDGQIIGSAYVNGGSATIQLDESMYLPGDILTLAVFGFNKITHLDQINVINANGPFLTFDNFDIEGRNNFLAGENTNFAINIKNVGSDDATGVSVTLTTEDTNIVLSNNENISFGDIPAGQTVGKADFYAQVNLNVEDLHKVKFHLTLTDDQGNTWEKDIYVDIYAPDLQQDFVGIKDTGLYFSSIPVTMVYPERDYLYNIKVDYSEGNGNGFLDAGEKATLTFLAFNTGHALAKDIIATFSTDNQHITLLKTSETIPFINVGDTVQILLPVEVSEDITSGERANITMILSYNALQDTFNKQIIMGIVLENFETGDFSSYWQNSGDYLWEITNNNPYEGNYCAGINDSLDNNQSSSLSVILNDVPQGSQLIFHYKVSSEEDYDFLKFKVNGTEVASWSGEVDWSEYVYDFNTTGDYTLTWAYEKDGSVSDGDDKAWLDYIVFPVAPASKSVKNITISAVEKPDWLSFGDLGDGNAILQGTAPNLDSVYYVKLEATDGITTDQQIFTIAVTTLTNTDKNGKFVIYPNPVVDFVNIVLPAEDIYNINIFDLSGKEVLNQKTKSGNYLLDLRKLEKGTYIININSKSKNYSGKLVVK